MSNEMGGLYVIDTHVLIWYFLGSPRLKGELKERIDDTRNRNGRILVPTIVLAEALYVAEKGRVVLDFDELYRLVRGDAGFEIVGFTSEILEEATRCRDIPEMHDRIIVATARFFGAGILTKDEIVLRFQEGQVSRPWQ